MKKKLMCISALLAALLLLSACTNNAFPAGTTTGTADTTVPPTSITVPTESTTVPGTQAQTEPVATEPVVTEPVSTEPVSTEPSTGQPPAAATPAPGPASPAPNTPQQPQGGNHSGGSNGIIAEGLWDGGPVTWKITADGVLTISGNRSVQVKPEYIWKDYSDRITRIVIEDGITNIPKKAFSNMRNVTSVYLGNAVEKIESEAFKGCTSLAAITIPKSTKKIDTEAFLGCSNMHTLTFAPDCALQEIASYAFSGAGIQDFTAPPNLQVVQSNAFQNCAQLANVRVVSGSLVAWAFHNCTGLQTLYIGEAVTNVAPYAFEGCNAITKLENYCSQFNRLCDRPQLTTLVIGGNRPSSGQYNGCANLRDVTILSPINAISGGAFEGCTSLTSFTIPDTVTSVGSSAFRNTGLTSITIPASVTELGLSAFADCPLREITFVGNCPMGWDNYIFGNVQATAYYPAGNETWTEQRLTNYGGTLTWAAK